MDFDAEGEARFVGDVIASTPMMMPASICSPSGGLAKGMWMRAGISTFGEFHEFVASLDDTEDFGVEMDEESCLWVHGR